MKALRLTPYRAAVLAALRASRSHPTASEVYRQVRRQRPGVAYATIYNALGWLVRHGLASELKISNGASRYDPITRRHDHLVCIHCGALVNYEVSLPQTLWAQAGRRLGFRVEHYRLELFGLCKECARASRRLPAATMSGRD